MRRRSVRAAALLGATLLFAGCDGLFEATNPGSITEDGLTSDASLNALVNGVIGRYDNAYDNIVYYSGLVSDELIGGDTSEGAHAASRRGVFINNPAGGSRQIPTSLWNPLHSARYLAEETYDRLQSHAGDPRADARVALVRLYAGLAYRDFADLFCEATYDQGPAVAQAESYSLAEERFTEALEVATRAGVDSVATMARLQRARIHLERGDFAAAAEDAGTVPAGFLWEAHYANRSGEENGVYNFVNINAFGTVDTGYHHTGDPRVVVDSVGTFAPDGVTPRWDPLKYPDRGSNIPVGKWQEARMIEAEALIAQSDPAAAVARLNEVRAAAGLSALDTAMSPSDAEAALRGERKHELFLESSHRMLDMRRWGLFPEGWETCVPIPYAEVQDNPNL